MNKYIEVINFACNLILSYSLIMFYLYIYGDKSKVVHKWKFVSHWSLKAGFIWMIMGTMFNMLTVDIPSFSQLTLNIGLTLVFLWAYLFHRKLFRSKTNEDEKIVHVQKDSQDSDYAKSQRQRVYEVVNSTGTKVNQNGQNL